MSTSLKKSDVKQQREKRSSQRFSAISIASSSDINNDKNLSVAEDKYKFVDDDDDENIETNGNHKPIKFEFNNEKTSNETSSSLNSKEARRRSLSVKNNFSKQNVKMRENSNEEAVKEKVKTNQVTKNSLRRSLSNVRKSVGSNSKNKLNKSDIKITENELRQIKGKASKKKSKEENANFEKTNCKSELIKNEDQDPVNSRTRGQPRRSQNLVSSSSLVKQIKKSNKDLKSLEKQTETSQLEITNNPKDETNTKSTIPHNWKVGSLLDARDRNSAVEKFYKSRIIEIRDNKEAKIHFLGWNSRYDQWYDMFNEADLKPCKDEKEKFSNNSNHKKFEVGAKIMAKWKIDEVYYPATVKRLVEKDDKLYYDIVFYDGVKKLVFWNNVKELTDEVAKLYPDSSPETTTSISALILKKEEDSRRAEAELLLAIQQPQLIVSSESEASNFCDKNKDELKMDTNLKKELNVEKLNDALTTEISQETNKLKDLKFENEAIKLTGVASEIEKQNKNDVSIVNEKISEIETESAIETDKNDSETNSTILDKVSIKDTVEIQTKIVEKIEESIADSSSNFAIPNSPAITSSILESHATTSSMATSSTNNSSSNVRKSLRAKRLRSFTDEIIFDSPLPMTHHLITETSSLAPISSPIASSSIPSNVVSNSLTPTTSGKRKKATSSSIEPCAKKSTEISETKKEDTKKISKSLKKSILASNVNQETKSSNKKSKKELSSEKPSKKLEKKQLAEQAKREKQNLSLKSKMSKRDERKRLKKLEKSNKKKLLLKMLLESSQQLLKQQQENIEQHLKKHEHKKTKKKLKKLLKEQQQQQQQLLQTNTNPNVFFPPISNQLTNKDYFQNFNIQPQLETHSLQTPILTPSTPNELIRCNFKNCNKTFRKISLLEYHLKYHHYVSINSNINDLSSDLSSPVIQQDTTVPITAKRVVKRTSRLSTSSNQANNKDSATILDTEQIVDDAFMIDEEEEETITDPYEVIHCKCGNHTSNGFMIQCEICLCWQHGDCINVKTQDNVPKHYLCWICKDPGNKLKKLKYQSWMNNGRFDARSRAISNDLTNSNDLLTLSNRNDPEFIKLRLLNECSRKYYNLNLLMYTLEYQMSLFETLSVNKTISNQNNDVLDSIDEESWNQIEKLGLNIAHLQNCLERKFTDFNSKISEFETKYNNDQENLIAQNFNLEELYDQLESITS